MKTRLIRAGTIAAALAAIAASGMPIASAAGGGPADNAQIGTCLHADGLPGPGHTGRITVSPATCGTSDASMVITAVAGSPGQCPAADNQGWIKDSTGRILCYDLT